MKNRWKEQRDDSRQYQTAAAIERRSQTQSDTGSQTRRDVGKPDLREVPYPPQSVLPVGKNGRARSDGSVAGAEAWTQEGQPKGGGVDERDRTIAGGDRRDQHRKLDAEKRGLALGTGGRYGAQEKKEVLTAVEQVHKWCPELTLKEICQQLGLPRATLYRWWDRQEKGQLDDLVTTPNRKALPPTPTEVNAVHQYAQNHPQLGYKRLAWDMVDEDIAYLRPWMVYQVLAEGNLLARRQPAPEGLRRPAPADHPDQRWHTDLMMLYFSKRWFWLVDVVDAYSRYLVYCEVLLTARANEVQMAAQRAIESLASRERRPGEPEIVHDGGPQYTSRDWRLFVQNVGMTDVRTMPYHPQSNGRDERVHRTIREEVPIEAGDTLYLVQERIENYRVYYNERRPHSAIRYLRPVDYYRGDPEARLVERQEKLRWASEVRKIYWNS